MVAVHTYLADARPSAVTDNVPSVSETVTAFYRAMLAQSAVMRQ